jgi:hypothetical protein
MSETLEKCASPTCQVTFEPSGLAMEPKRYCCDACKMDVYALRRVRKLLENETDERVLEILRCKP